MAQVTVFVDDAVLGRLPGLCVKEGVATTDRLIVRSPMQNGNGFGIAWLLLLAGPIGWLGFLIFSGFRRSEVLTVQLPFSQVAHDRLREARRNCWLASVAVLIFGVVALIGVGRETFDGRLFGAAVGVLAVVAVTRWVIELRRLRACSVDVRLDASRRWVWLDRVHPSFAQRVLQENSHSQLM